jgi:sulfur relay (sulfurtransferase) complex TusBCD TusD component (DsrE family)
MDASNTVIIVRNYGMGKSDDTLQTKLFGKYLQLITEGGLLPNSICFYTDGVKCVTADSPVLSELKTIEEKGVRLIVCNTCLQYLGVKAEVGIVGGMTDIIEAQFSAEKVITL